QPLTHNRVLSFTHPHQRLVSTDFHHGHTRVETSNIQRFLKDNHSLQRDTIAVRRQGTEFGECGIDIGNACLEMSIYTRNWRGSRRGRRET
ncbi:hypothetical protein BDN70DRAFT_888455, partial [Pholiota conissans]